MSWQAVDALFRRWRQCQTFFRFDPISHSLTPIFNSLRDEANERCNLSQPALIAQTQAARGHNPNRKL